MFCLKALYAIPVFLLPLLSISLLSLGHCFTHSLVLLRHSWCVQTFEIRFSPERLVTEQLIEFCVASVQRIVTSNNMTVSAAGMQIPLLITVVTKILRPMEAMMKGEIFLSPSLPVPKPILPAFLSINDLHLVALRAVRIRAKIFVTFITPLSGDGLDF